MNGVLTEDPKLVLGGSAPAAARRAGLPHRGVRAGQISLLGSLTAKVVGRARSCQRDSSETNLTASMYLAA
jgi:hypothetical protein